MAVRRCSASPVRWLAAASTSEPGGLFFAEISERFTTYGSVLKNSEAACEVALLARDAALGVLDEMDKMLDV